MRIKSIAKGIFSRTAEVFVTLYVAAPPILRLSPKGFPLMPQNITAS
jgi:hypothetical protein